MMDRINALKLYLANMGSWFATIASMTAVKDVLQILCFLASLIVSICSIWWIRRQARVLDEKSKQEHDKTA